MLSSDLKQDGFTTWTLYHDKLQPILIEFITRQRGRKLYIVNIVFEKHVETAVWCFSLCFTFLEVNGNSGFRAPGPTL